MFPGIPVNFSLFLFTGILDGVQIDGKPQHKWDMLLFEFKKPFLEAYTLFFMFYKKINSRQFVSSKFNITISFFSKIKVHRNSEGIISQVYTK